MEQISPIERAKGDMNQTEFAKLIGVTQPLVSYWLARKQVGPEYVLIVEAKTGVSRHELCPDVFGPAPGVLPSLQRTPSQGKAA